jgi:hypothetical protein
VCLNSFALVRGVHSNPLRSRERRFESRRGHTVISQDIEDTVNPRRVTVFLVLGRVAGR